MYHVISQKKNQTNKQQQHFRTIFCSSHVFLAENAFSYFVWCRNVCLFLIFLDIKNDIWHLCLSYSTFAANPGNYFCIFLFFTLLRSFQLHRASVFISKTSLQQLLTSQNIYCKEAVKSVKIVESCPSSKTEWDRAADIKNCGKIAPEQKCASFEKFKYHCVINGRRNKLMEVCAPTRIIFGIFYFYNVLFIFVHFSSSISLILSYFWNSKIWLIFRTLCRIQCSRWSYSRSKISPMQPNISKVCQHLFLVRCLQM